MSRRRERTSPRAPHATREPERSRALKRPALLAAADAPAAPRQKRSRDKRARLKDAALALFAEKGFERTSIAAIARRARCGTGGFYTHFRSKRQLLLALMDELLQRLEQLDLRPRPTSGGVRAALRDLLGRAFAHDLRYLGAYRAWHEAVLSDADLAMRHEAVHVWTRARITALFTMLSQQPGARTQVDIAGLSRAIDELFWGLLAQAAIMPRVELAQWIDASTHLIFHALFTDPPSTGRRSLIEKERR